MKLHRILIYALVFFALFLGRVNAQNKNVGINDTGENPEPSAMLDIKSNNKGLLIPRVALQYTTSNAPIGSDIAVSLLVYNTATTGDVEPGYYYWDGTQWRPVGSGCITLDEAYDCGGSGYGRIITADAKPVTVNVPANAASQSIGFGVVTQNDQGVGIVSQVAGSGIGIAAQAQNDGDGVSLLASNQSAAANYSTIESHTKSTKSTQALRIGAVAGITEGTACGVVGEAETNANADAGVWGNNLMAGSPSNASCGVEGSGYLGVYAASYDSNQDYMMSLYAVQNVYADGSLWAQGDLIVGGGKQFRIDHPLEPENKFLNHYCLESPEVLNVYRGNVTLDSKGEADVMLPEYFSSINVNYSYNLTPVGASAPELFVKNEVRGNTFSIGGGKPGMKVSWTLYAERNDLYYQKNPDKKIVELNKKDSQIGKYINPELYNKPENKGIYWMRLNDKYHEAMKTGKKPELNKLPESRRIISE